MFEENTQRLKEIAEALEEGSTTLETALAFYTEGAKLAALCKAQLDAAEQVVREVMENQ